MTYTTKLIVAMSALTFAAAPAAAQLSLPLDSATLAGFKWRSIGPANMGGRVSDVEAIGFPSKTMYVAAAAGGIWKSVNNGTTFFPVWENEKVISMGDIAIAPSDTTIIWAGSGEEDSRNSISPGGGIWKSTDGGLTWQFMGLEKTETIGRIVIHPTNPDIVYVAALGAIWRSNPERGLYKTMDGGRTWTMSKFISDKAGFVDLVMDPRNPDVLWASSWERVRGPYFLNSGGPGSALWKSTDAGRTWTEVKGGGFPETMKGRIGIAIARSNPDVMYTLVEADTTPNPKPQQGARAQRRPSGLYRSADGGKTWTYMSTANVRPFYYSQVRVDPTNPDRVYWSSTPVNFSDDGGKTTRSTANSVHVDTHAMWIDPNDPERIIIGHDGGVSQTWDRGGTWEDLRLMAIGQFYAISYDMAVPYSVCGGMQDNGTWCGPSRKRSGPILYADWNHVGGGDGFVTAQDPRDPNVVYMESQGGSMRRRNFATGEQVSLRPAAWQQARQRYQAEMREVHPDTTKAPTREQSAKLADIRKRMAADSVQLDYRWNWNTPFILSPHTPSVFYAGGNRVFKSVKMGEDLRPISPDLSTNDTMRIRVSTRTTGGITPDATGAETHGTVVSLGESPVRPGILYAGTDDGNVWLTRNDGVTWENLTGRFPGVPRRTWVSHVEPSRYDSATVYVAFDNHQEGDFTPYVYVSTDFGKTFRRITDGIPADRPNFVHVVTEDPASEHVLYVGTDVGVYVSVNKGGTWQQFMTGLPTVPVHDLKVHPRDRELIAGTHGRSIWIVNVAPLQQLADSIARKPLHVFASATAFQYSQPPSGGQSTNGNADKFYAADNAPYGAEIVYRLASASATPVSIVITDVKGDTVRTLDGPREAGLHRVTWNFARGNPQQFAGGGGGGGRGGQGAEAREPENFPGFPKGYNPRPAEGPVVPQASPSYQAPEGQGGRRGGGGRFGGGGANAGPVDTGDYLVTVTAGGQKMSQVIRVVNLGAALNAGGFFGGEEGDGGERR